MKNDPEIFGGKKFSDILEEIHKNSTDKKVQIDLLISELTGYIQTANDVVQIVPLISQYLEVAVKNDEQLVKLAAIVQKIVAAENRVSSEGEFGLSDSEKEQLMTSLDTTVKDLQKRSDEIISDMDELSDVN